MMGSWTAFREEEREEAEAVARAECGDDCDIEGIGQLYYAS